MYNEIIHKRIEHVGQIISDLKSCEADINFVSDPILKQEIIAEHDQLAEELDFAGRRCLVLLEAYMEDCKREQVPVFLDYYRVLVALRNARIIDVGGAS